MMKILIAEDDAVSRRLLETRLKNWGYEVVVACDGDAAWQALQGPNSPRLAILDWMMPGVDGVGLCRRLRQTPALQGTYVILLTARKAAEDKVAGLESGADDYIIKPFERDELQARLRVGLRILTLQQNLADRVRELEGALLRVKQLQGLLPICSYCKKVRDDQNYWQQVEEYITTHADVRFTHGICPGCFQQFVQPQLDRLARQSGPT
jgi:DNA-binding response OmpR family regulator